jgi:hypothetical protein
MAKTLQSVPETPSCPNCKNSVMRRIAREGLLENRVYAKAGLYPWECPLCRDRVLLKNRGAKIRKKSQESV